ncbi:MAG: hypothetical protein SGJ27_31150 [Candidatus Melainabacteria bacterium]|nr:hypothetical protein [Candidatus Melainabacteria bacterium]
MTQKEIFCMLVVSFLGVGALLSVPILLSAYFASPLITTCVGVGSGGAMGLYLRSSRWLLAAGTGGGIAGLLMSIVSLAVGGVPGVLLGSVIAAFVAAIVLAGFFMPWRK